MLTLTKPGFKIIFSNNKNSELNDILRELHLMNPDGILVKHVMVHRGVVFNELDSIKITSMGRTYYIIDSTINFKYSSVSQLVDKLNSLFSDYSIFIDNVRFDGSFDLINSKLVKNKSGDYLAIGDFHSGTDHKLDNFIHLMKRDNGHIITPLTKRFLRTILFMKNHKHAILGYAHLPTYLKTIKMESVENTSGDSYQPDNRASYVLNIKKNSVNASINILDISDNKANLKINIDGASLIKNNPTKTSSPYVLIAAKPIEIDNHRIPFFPVRFGKIPVFVSVLLFNDDTHLRTVPGSIDLLQIQ